MPPSATSREGIVGNFGTPPAATYVHDLLNPDAQFDAYQKFLAVRIADGVRVALANLEPARVGWGVGGVPQHVFNGRWKMKPGKQVLNPFGGVPSDHISADYLLFSLTRYRSF